MSEFTHEGTENLQKLAEQVEQERVAKGHTAFDDKPAVEDEGADTREDHVGVDDPLGDAPDTTRAGIVGAAGRVQRPGL